MLDKQINLFSVNTDAFLYDEEREIKRRISNKNEKTQLLIDLAYRKLLCRLLTRGDICSQDNYIKLSRDLSILKGEDKVDFSSLKSKIINCKDEDVVSFITSFDNKKRTLLKSFGRYKRKQKTILLELLSKNLYFERCRALNPSYIEYIDAHGDIKDNINNIISIFESDLTRSFGAITNELTKDIIIVEIWYYDLAKDIILNGFDYKGEHYVYFSSSAGQIRTKKAVFVLERKYLKIQNKLTCGLSVDKINAHGGMNVNKYLAYLALCNSATEEWEQIFGNKFDIDRCVVVDDFETDVKGYADYINYETYEITPNKLDDFRIPHTDGCGMILKSYIDKNFMIRLPWIKGLLGSFDYVKFIERNNCSSKIIDIWGKEYDIIKDDIKIIFTKSQLKMNKYYGSWTEYKDNFKRYNCSACVCNVEEDKIKQATINYQMLQSLYDMTDEEVANLCKKSNDKIERISSSLENMLDVFGVSDTANIKEDDWFKKALAIYPELIKDVSNKDTLRDLKNSLVKKYKSGRLEIQGKFTFVLPDLYAFCEWLFMGIETPLGLLQDGEVFCKLYKYHDKLDCLRSPSLYIEHPVRNNVCNKKYRNTRLDEWFDSNAVYTSSHDLISRYLQLDM